MLTCHFDTYHWNRLAAGRLGVDQFKDAVRQGKIAPVLSFIHMLEFASRKPQGTRAMVGRFIEEVISLGTVKWIHLRGGVEEAEYQNEFCRFMRWPTVSLQVFEDTLTDVMPHDIGSEEEASWRQEPIPVQLESLSRSPDRIGDYMKYKKEEHPSNVSKEVAEPWRKVLRPIGYSILMPNGKIKPRTKQMETAFQEFFNLERCPAVQLSYAYNTKWKKNPPAVKDSDLEDLNHLAAAAYCDVAFVDGRTHDLLEQGRISPLPKRNGEFEEWLQNL